MRSKNMVLAIAVLLALLSVAPAAFAGPGREKGTPGQAAGKYSFPYKGPEIVLRTSEWNETILKKATENKLYWQEFQKRLGNVKFERSLNVDEDKMKVFLSTGEMPFDILGWWNAWNTAVTYGSAGTLLDLSKYESLMPNIMKVAAKFSKVRLGLTAEGKWFGLAASLNTNESRFMPWMGWRFNSYYLKKTGKNVPEKPEELYQYLKAVKEINPKAWPFLESYDNYTGVINGIFGAQIEVTYNPKTKKFENMVLTTAPQLKKATAFFSKLYSEELLPKDFKALPWERIQPVIYQNFDAYGVTPWMLYDAWKEEETIKKFQQTVPEFDLVMTQGVFDEGVTYQVWPYEPAGNPPWMGTFVNAKAKNPEFIAAFLDYLWSPTMREMLWGVEGKTFKKTGNEYSMLPEIKFPANPTGGTVDANVEYGFNVMDPQDGSPVGWMIGAFPGDYEYKVRLSPYNQKRIDPDRALWAKVPADQRRRISRSDVILTQAEQDKVASVLNAFNKFVGEELTKFQIGQRSMEEFGAFIDEVKTKYNCDEALSVLNSKPIAPPNVNPNVATPPLF